MRKMAAMLRANQFLTYRDLVLATADEDTCRQWMRGNGLLANTKLCLCGGMMTEAFYGRNVLDGGRIWRCPTAGCRRTKGIRHGSLFAGSHLPLRKLLDLVYWWTIDTPVHTVELQTQVDHKTVTDWFSFLRDVCSAELLANPVRIGGVGHTVAIDESLIARRPRGNQQVHNNNNKSNNNNNSNCNSNNNNNGNI